MIMVRITEETIQSFEKEHIWRNDCGFSFNFNSALCH